MKPLLLSLLLLAASNLIHAAVPVLIDFGSVATPTEITGGPTWNNIDERNQHGLANFSLLDMKGNHSGILLTVESPFAGANRSGAKTDTAGYPASAVTDSLYANVESFNKQSNVTPVLRLSGLDPAKRYTLAFFASRIASDNRTTRYTVTGAETMQVELDAAAKTPAVAATSPLVPKADGTLTIVISPAPANDNANHFTYLGVLEIRIAD